MRLRPSLPMLLLTVIWIVISSLPLLRAQSSSKNAARSLDTLLQDYAYRALTNTPRIRTGTQYHANLPSNFTGINISALRLRSGSLRTKGVTTYKEFDIPKGVTERPYVVRLVMVYQNLGNWSSFYYPLHGYSYLAPVLGLLAYDASSLSATNLSELDIKASDKPISIKFRDVKSVPHGSTAKCVWFDLDGLPQFSNVVSGNICSTVQQGHFSIVVESNAPSPAPVLPPSTGGGGGGKKNNSRVWKIVAIAVGGFLLLVVLGLLFLCLQRYKRRKKMQQMEKAAEVGEALQMTSIGNTRAPIAMGTRTQPVIENEYVP